MRGGLISFSRSEACWTESWMTVAGTIGSIRFSSIDHGHWRAVRYVIEKLSRHECRHADTAMRSWIAREESRVHPDPTVNPHEERHLRTIKDRSWRLRILLNVNILLNHVPVT